MASRNKLSREEASVKAKAAWTRRHAEGTARGWSEERRAKFRATIAAKYPKALTAAQMRAELLDEAVVELQAQVRDLAARVKDLEKQPLAWRPDHRRLADGGRPVRDQRREAGLR